MQRDFTDNEIAVLTGMAVQDEESGVMYSRRNQKTN